MDGDVEDVSHFVGEPQVLSKSRITSYPDHKWRMHLPSYLPSVYSFLPRTFLDSSRHVYIICFLGVLTTGALCRKRRNGSAQLSARGLSRNLHVNSHRRRGRRDGESRHETQGPRILFTALSIPPHDVMIWVSLLDLCIYGGL